MTKILFCSVSAGSRKALEAPMAEFIKRIGRFAQPEEVELKSETSLLDRLQKERIAAPTLAVLLDSRGTLLTSEEFANEIGSARDLGKRTILFAVGPPDGWSEQALKSADIKVSLGRMTLPHQLAYLVLTEQVYRAFTILAGHPYHSGH